MAMLRLLPGGKAAWLLASALLASAAAVPAVPAAPAAPASHAPDREHRVKAVFLFNFAQFVDWPDSAFAGPDDPLVVGILGDDPFGNFLDEVVRGETADGHPIEIRRFRHRDEIRKCHVLFIAPEEAVRLNGRIAALGERRTLTVGESREFLAQGGMVLFVNEGGKVRFRINLEAVQAAGLSLSSKLLRLADIAGPRRD